MFSFSPVLVWLWVVLIGAGCLHSWVLARRRASRLPPGPAPLPLIGNALDFPRQHLGLEFLKMTKRYGDVVYLNVLGKEIILLGSSKAAYDLLDRSSANYSDRPVSVMVQLVGFDWLMPLMNYCAEWRNQRRALHQVLNRDAVAQYRDIQFKVTRDLMRNLLDTPHDLALHLRFAFASALMRIIYGLDLHERSDQYFKMAERMGEVGEEIVVPGRFYVEALPLLRFMPAWFPGGSFKRFAAEAKRDIRFAVDHLFDTARAAMDQGVAKESFITRLLDGTTLHENGGEAAEAHLVCRDLAASSYVAGVDTTNATIEAFFLAMALFPEVQQKAQAELDAVVGMERLPEYSDRPSLPYVSALIKELLRWHVAAPIGVPHRVVADDVYNGFLIPAGATIFVNAWALSRDAVSYPDPEAFQPERFLKNGMLHVEGKDPAEFTFGFGRRVCPGRFFAEESLFILCASVLAVFHIDAPITEAGERVKVIYNVTTNAAVSHAFMYKYAVRRRPFVSEQLIREL